MLVNVPLTQSVFNSIAENLSMDNALKMLFESYGVKEDDVARLTGYTIEMLDELERINNSD